MTVKLQLRCYRTCYHLSYMPGMRTIILLLYCWFLILQYNILLLLDQPIQYIVIVQETNTIYCYCPTDQYNILLLSDRPIQYIDNNILQYIAIYCSYSRYFILRTARWYAAQQ